MDRTHAFRAEWVQRVTVEAGRLDFFDTTERGLVLRVSSNGRKAWTYAYQYKGERRRQSIGAYPGVTLADAREAVREIKRQLERGHDPYQARQDAQEAPSIEWLVSEYLERYARPRKRSWKGDENKLTKDVLPAWGKRKAQEITRRDVIALLDQIADRAPIQANRTLACIRRMFNWAVSRDLLPASPCAQVKAPSQEHQSDRVLSDAEIRAVWQAAGELVSPVGDAIRLQLLTAQRTGEVMGMAWDEVDLEAGWWTIPTERAKNKRSHRVPLSPMALALLEARKGDGRYVFESRIKVTERPVSSPYSSLKTARKLSGVDFILHDLRRTAATGMASLGVPRLTVSKILNHVETGVTAVYDRHSYDKEKREALSLWADRLAAILQG